MSLEADIEDIQSGLKAPKKVIVFVDELNKYAPEGAKGSPILDQVLEVSERGRSLGIVLYGAQQFLSAVHDRVTGNCSTTLLGRTNASEMAERSYRFLNRDIKAAATRLEKGQLILNHAVFREPVKIKFPAITCDRRRLGELFCHDSLEKAAAIHAAPDRAISGVSCDLAIIFDCEVYPAPI